MPSHVFVTGGSGFVGSAVIDELIDRNFTVTAISHRGALDDRGGRVRVVKGDLFDQSILLRGLDGCDAIIHLVGIIREHTSRGVTFERIHVQGTQCIIDAAEAAGIRRYIHMSALGARRDAISHYHQTKYRAEQEVRQRVAEWTIFRPSIIHGPGGEFTRMEAAWARGKAPPFLFMPYFGRGVLGLGGSGLIQPIYVKDVARGMVDAIDRMQSFGQVYAMGGPDLLTWPTMHHIVAQVLLGKRRATVPLPAWLAMTLASTPGLRAMLPFNRAQVIMSRENSTCDMHLFTQHFGWKPQSFRSAVEAYADQL